MRAGALTLAIGSAVLAGAQEAPRIRVPVRMVSVPTLVLSHEGRVMDGLQASDFRIRDNGRPQPVAVDTSFAPLSIVLAVQANLGVRRYLPSIISAASVFEGLLVGDTGEVSVIAYSGDVEMIKSFGEGGLRGALRTISPTGERCRVIDAGVRAVSELARRPAGRNRVLIFVGQQRDRASEFSFEYLRMKAAQANVTVYALTLPEAGKSFLADTFRLHKIDGAKGGGFTLGLDFDYGRVLSAAKTSAMSALSADPLSRLVAATGGTQFSFREAGELERAVTAIGSN